MNTYDHTSLHDEREKLIKYIRTLCTEHNFLQMRIDAKYDKAKFYEASFCRKVIRDLCWICQVNAEFYKEDGVVKMRLQVETSEST